MAQGAVCDPVHPGFNGSAWHTANGSVVNGSKVHSYYDAERGTNSTGYDGTLSTDWNSISWSDGMYSADRVSCFAFGDMLSHLPLV